MRRRPRELPPNVTRLRDWQPSPSFRAETVTEGRPAVLDFGTWRDQLRPPPAKQETLVEMMLSIIAEIRAARGEPPAA